MRLLQAIEAYQELRLSLGAVFKTDIRILRSFGRASGDLPLSALSPEACQAFCRRPIRSLTRTNNVVNQVALVVDQSLLRCGRRQRVAGHDVVMMKLDHVCGAAQLTRGFAIPDRK